MRQASLFSRLHTIAASRRSSSMSASSDRTMLRPFACKIDMCDVSCQCSVVELPNRSRLQSASFRRAALLPADDLSPYEVTGHCLVCQTADL